MGFLLTLIVLTLVIYWLRTRSAQHQAPDVEQRPTGDLQTSRQESQQEPHDDEPAVTVVTRKVPEVLVDLRDEAERSFRVVGSSHWVPQDVVWQYQLNVFFLHREPDNPYDENAIAVYGGERKFGYLSAGAAAQYAPLLDQIGADFIVARDNKDLARMWFRLPRVPVLRARMAAQEIRHWKLEHAELQAGRTPPATIPKADKNLTGGYPCVGGPHSNGDQVFGYYEGYAADLRAAGTPTVSSLRRNTITDAIQDVRIGDKLQLKNVNKSLVVSKLGREVGRLTWNDHEHRFDGGVLEVQRVFIDVDGKVANCGGKALPAE